MATTGHENEVIDVEGLKASLQKYKTSLTDVITVLATQNHEDIQGLRNMLNGGNLGDVKAKTIDLEELPKVVGSEIVISEPNNPTRPPKFVGQKWFNTVTGMDFSAISVTGALTDWRPTGDIFVTIVSQIMADLEGIRSMISGNLGAVKAESVNTTDMPMVCGAPLITVSSSAPTTPPKFVGQMWVNTGVSPSYIYTAKAVTGSTGDWV